MSESKIDNDVTFTHLGHAGMMFENQDTIIMCDPWIVPGAFDDSWFQYPRNDHMGDVIKYKIENSGKDVYIFVSHEHMDHYDPRFLNSLPNRNFTIIVADFRRPFLLDWFKKYECKRVITLKDAEEYVINENVKFTLCVEDCEMNRDCGLLVKMNNYVIYNGNDCKYPYYDKLGIYGDLDVFAQQFSGATWHPICYDYDKEHMDLITTKKRNTKSSTLIKYIKALNVKMYVPCAGPPVFLDPELFPLILENFTIFPRANWIKDKFFDEFGDKLRCEIFMPGDVYSLNEQKMVYLDKRRVNDYNRKEYVEYVTKYKNDYAHIFEKREIENNKINIQLVFSKLLISLRQRLNTIKKCNLSKVKIFDTYFQLFDYDETIKVDFHNSRISVENIKEDFLDNNLHVYVFKTHAWQINKVLTGELTWEEMMITFRPKLFRRPDVFSTLLNAFIFQQEEDVKITFDLILSGVDSKDKIIVETPEGEYYEICRKCPHQGQDLTISDIEDSRFLVCPKHCWKFDLKNGGKSLTTMDTLNAVKIKKPCKSKKVYSLKSNDDEFINFTILKKELFVKSTVNRPIYKLTLSKNYDHDDFLLSNTDHIVMKINNISRPYTFIMDKDLLTIYIKLYHDGQMSNQVRQLKENSIVMIKRYKTEIEFNKMSQYKKLFLLAGGTGITPFFRIIKNFIDKKDIDIVYCNSLSNEILLKNELDKIEKLNIHYYNTNEQKDHLTKNYLLINKLIDLNPNTVFLICGPPGFTENAIKIFKELQIPDNNIILFDLVN